MCRTLLSALTACVLALPAAAQQTLTERADSATAPFERGSYLALGAVERLLQAQYRHGFGQGFGLLTGLRNRDLLNPEPLAREADTFRSMVSGLAADLDAARAELAQTDPTLAGAFELDLAQVFFDVNSNGRADPGEGGFDILQSMMRAGRGGTDPAPETLVVRFDGADHAWLTAYTHALSATAEAILAFDPTPVFADLLMMQAAMADLPEIPNPYDPAALQAKLAELEAERQAIIQQREARNAASAPLRAQRRELSQKARAAKDEAEKAALRAQMASLDELLRSPEYDNGELYRKERLIAARSEGLRNKLRTEGDARRPSPLGSPDRFDEMRNSLYALVEVLRSQPDPTHLARMREHLRAMLAQNRLFWQAVAEETDNDREWVPNAQQVSAFGIEIDAALANSWQAVLDDVEALLEGRLLLAHPLLGEGVGINLAAWFDNPSPLDPVGWIHGRDALPYLARGPLYSRDNWLEFQFLTGGRGLAFGFYLN